LARNNLKRKQHWN